MSDDPFAQAAQHTGAKTSGIEALQLPSDLQVAACMRDWLSRTTRADRADPDPSAAPALDTRLFAKLIAARDARNELALLGLQAHEWRALLARHFAGYFGHATMPALPQAISPSEHASFMRALHSLLIANASTAVHVDDARCLATIIVHACLRPDHLWRDLGLAGRDEVTWMLTRYFPALVALNVENLRWKKFLAAQCALSLGLPPGPAPGCPGCEDYGYCFASRT
nr:nitrogen fixation protein NifQ [Paraburkholderia susongensis]